MPRRPRPVHRRLHVEELEGRALLAGDMLSAAAAFNITPFSNINNASSLVSALLAPNSGIQLVPDSAQYQGEARQGGTYQGLDFNDQAAAQQLSILDGILLTTGDASGAKDNDGPAEGVNLEGIGDELLSALVGGSATYDANSLTFQFTAPTDAKSIQLQLIFGSEEFPVYVSSYNDVLGIFLDGQQIAFDNQNRPVTVSNNFFKLNNTDPNDTDNPHTEGKTTVDFNQLEYNGLTPRLFTTAPLNPDVSVHTLRIAIADTTDQVLDSGVFLAGLKALTTTVDGPTTGETPPTENPPDNEPPDNEPPDNEPPDNEPPDNEPPDNEPPDNEPPDNEPPDNEPPDNEPPDSEPPAETPDDLSAAQFGSVVGIVGTPSIPALGTTFIYPVASSSAFVPSGSSMVASLTVGVGSAGGDILQTPWDIALNDDESWDLVVDPLIPEAPANFNMRHADGELIGWSAEDPDLYLFADDSDGFILQNVALEKAMKQGRKLAMFVADTEPALLVETSTAAGRLAVDQGDEQVQRTGTQTASITTGVPDQSAKEPSVEEPSSFSWKKFGAGACILASGAGLAAWQYLRRSRKPVKAKPPVASHH